MGHIDALLEAAGESLERLREEYAATLTNKSVSAQLQVRIKNTVENQRSALDYLAYSITQEHGNGGTRQTYYPLARSGNDFERLFSIQMPGVAEARPDIRETIRRHQPWQPGCAWLGHLSAVTNENKHRNLTPQTRSETHRFTSGPGGGHIGVSGGAGITFGEGTSITMPPGTGMSMSGPGAPVYRNMVQTVFVDWLFEDPPVSVLGLLGEVQEKLPVLIRKVRHVVRNPPVMPVEDGTGS